MGTKRYSWHAGLAFLVFAAAAAKATSIPRFCFEQLVDESDAIVSGTASRTWSEWDAAHQFIWTRTVILVAATHKGPAEKTVVVSELGGQVDGRGMSVAGSPRYTPGDIVVVFLKNYPGLGYRTYGWGQGRYELDAAGKIHGAANSGDLHVFDLKAAKVGTPLTTLDGITLRELHTKIAGRVNQVLTGAAK